VENQNKLIYSYKLPAQEKAPGGQVYLGAILAFMLFFSFFFGSILFFLIIVIISVFLFLSKDEVYTSLDGNVWVGIYDDMVVYGPKAYRFKEIRNFSIHNEVFGEEQFYLRIKLSKPGSQDVFIPIGTEMQKNTVYDIIRKSVVEDKNRILSLTDQIVLKFF
jgi:hypothetical protein